MSTQYLILENRQIMDGEIYDHDGVVKASVYADPGAVIFAFDLDEVIRDGAGSIRVVTEDIVLDAHHAGLHDDPPFDRCHLAGDHIEFPLTHAEALANRADDQRSAA